MRLKNSIARRASRNSSSKAAGPSALTETLSHDHRSSRVHGREGRIAGERENTKNMLLYCVSVLRTGATGRTHRRLDPASEFRVYQRRPASRFDAIQHHRARPSLRNLSTLDLVIASWWSDFSSGPFDSLPEIEVLARDVGVARTHSFLPFWDRRSTHKINPLPSGTISAISRTYYRPQKPRTPKGTIVNGLQGTASFTVVALGASAGGSKTCHTYLIHSAHTTYYSVKAQNSSPARGKTLRGLVGRRHWKEHVYIPLFTFPPRRGLTRTL
jgi:hypothetical protein